MRLIDADELLQEFETENVAHNSDIWHITGIKAFIENQPTAFDVEKVVEELEEESNFFGGEPMGSLQKAYYCKGVEKAIGIVKAGGMK